MKMLLLFQKTFLYYILLLLLLLENLNANTISKPLPSDKDPHNPPPQLNGKIKLTMSAWALFPVDNWCGILGDMKRFELKDYLWTYMRVFMALQDAQLDPGIKAHVIHDAVVMVCAKWLTSAIMLEIPREYFEERIDERVEARVKAALEPLVRMNESEIGIICKVFDHRHVIDFATLYYRDILRISNSYEKFLCNLGNLKHFLETWLDICEENKTVFFKHVINVKIDLVRFACCLRSFVDSKHVQTVMNQVRLQRPQKYRRRLLV